MEIFLVRHGETGGNVAHRHQAEETPLSVKGRQQAATVAQEIKKLNPTHLVSSSLVRTVETASVIGDACDLIPETHTSLIELVRPKHMYGHRHHSLKSKLFYAQWFFGRTKDGESYEELRGRIKEAKKLLSQYPDDAKVIVVTHSVFMSLFVAHICCDESLSLFDAVKVFRKILSMPNAHMTKLQFDGEVSDDLCAWSVG
ncbi:MAG: histidine phosphatase family protein [Candidatus Pacebacteria bacterium]|nr:histidine phosphatase family protein [Candidatus Paceibacterota bacterium]